MALKIEKRGMGNLSDLWVKIEDFQDEEGRLNERRINGAYSVILQITAMRILRLSEEVANDPNVIELALKEAMYSVQKVIEERIFERLPEITEKTMIAGRKFQIYVTSNMPKGAPILVINPETWATKWRAFLGSRYWEYLFEHTEEVLGCAEDSKD